MGQDTLSAISTCIEYAWILTFLTRIAWPGINRLFAYCKDGNFNIHIWVLLAISSAKQEKSGSIYDLVKN